MKINESAVALSGKRSYSKYQETRVESMTIRSSEWNKLQEALGNESAEVSISEESQSLLDKLKEQKKQEQEKMDKDRFKQMLEESRKVEEPVPQVASEDDQMIKTLRRILEMLKQIRSGKGMAHLGMLRRMDVQEVMSEDKHFAASVQRSGQAFSLSQQMNVLDLRSASTAISAGAGASSGASVGNGATTWIRHTEKSGFFMEQENTTFSATGVVKTADGREIQFGVDLEMSRGFAGSFFSSTDEEVVLTDPLVINLESGTASVSDQKFFFDLDADGKEEEISSLGQGSGFLAYDKNNDGTINDGSELFGTKSGDGFADLAAYDEDGNGWIDESDRIFNDLKVWTKDAEGKDKLVSLKGANVGAIYLGSANTQFHLNDAGNKTNAVIQKTGVFLRETGEVGTIQHVDLAL